MGELVFLIGISKRDIFIIFFGVIFLAVCIYDFYKAIGYKLELKRGEFLEFNNGKVIKLPFKNIESLDTEIYLGPKVASYTPIFHLTLENGQVIKYKTKQQASIYDIVNWIKENYPQTQITLNSNKIMNWARNGTWLWKSR